MKAFQTWTPRVRRLQYDALRQDVGCQAISGNAYNASLPFEQVCTFDHDPLSKLFNRSPRISYADGPVNTGGMPPWQARWAAWIASNGVRTGKLPSIELPGDAIGSPSSLFDDLSPMPTKVSIGFTAGGQIGIAIQRDGTTIEVKWFKDGEGVFGDEIFPGVSPVLFGNARLYSSDRAGETDLVLYYLRPALPKTIFARFEHDGFLIERTINADLPNSLASLIGSEAVGSRQKLYARDTVNRDVTLTSPVYIVKASRDKSKVSLEVARGIYRQAAVPAVINSGNQARLSIAIARGAYSDVIVEPTGVLSGDQGTLTVAIESGSYE